MILLIAGGLSELAGLAMVVREIASDRDRARQLLNRKRDIRPPRRTYPADTPAPPIKAPTWLDIRDGTATKELERRLTDLVQAVSEMRKQVDHQRDQLMVETLREIDRGDNELRQGFREILAGSLRERWIGVGALVVGIVLGVVGSVLSTLS